MITSGRSFAPMLDEGSRRSRRLESSSRQRQSNSRRKSGPDCPARLKGIERDLDARGYATTGKIRVRENRGLIAPIPMRALSEPHRDGTASLRSRRVQVLRAADAGDRRQLRTELYARLSRLRIDGRRCSVAEKHIRIPLSSFLRCLARGQTRPTPLIFATRQADTTVCIRIVWRRRVPAPVHLRSQPAWARFRRRRIIARRAAATGAIARRAIALDEGEGNSLREPLSSQFGNARISSCEHAPWREHRYVGLAIRDGVIFHAA